MAGETRKIQSPGLKFRPWRKAPGCLPAAAAALWPVLLGGCAAKPWLATPLTRLDLLAGAGLLMAAQTAALWGALRVTAARRQRRLLRERLLGDLRYLRAWDDEPGILRKVGMIRDLNALEAIPDDLEGCRLGGADLKGVLLDGCDLRGADLAEADLQGASLAGADLFGADLSGANLAFANLRQANLRGCNLDAVRLNKADLRRANLHRASLLNADLSGARLEGVTLDKARFASGRGDPLHPALHHSVEDWIRGGLDQGGVYHESGTAAEEDPEAPRLSDAG